MNNIKKQKYLEYLYDRLNECIEQNNVFDASYYYHEIEKIEEENTNS